MIPGHGTPALTARRPPVPPKYRRLRGTKWPVALMESFRAFAEMAGEGKREEAWREILHQIEMRRKGRGPNKEMAEQPGVVVEDVAEAMKTWEEERRVSQG